MTFPRTQLDSVIADFDGGIGVYIKGSSAESVGERARER